MDAFNVMYMEIKEKNTERMWEENGKETHEITF